MYIAMNRFQIAKKFQQDFVDMWANRESNLGSVPGFREFHLLKGPESEDSVIYATHVLWDSLSAFEGWTTSDAFKQSHAKAGKSNKGFYLGPPKFEGFEVVL